MLLHVVLVARKCTVCADQRDWHYPKHIESGFEAVISRVDAFVGDKVLYHCQLCSLESATVTVCAGKRFNHEAVSPQ